MALNKKFFKISAVILIIPVLFIIIILSLFCRQYDLTESVSQGGTYKITVKYRDTRAWPFGPHDVSVSYKKSGSLFSHNIIETELFNDGKTPDEGNCSIEWEGSVAYITLNGEEQEDEKYEMNFKTMECKKIS